MSRVSPVQTLFSGGEISQRLRARIDQGLYDSSLAEMTGFASLVEGPAEAMPGFIHVSVELGPCRLFRFEYNTTQGHVIAASDVKFRVYTNDALIEVGGNPLEIASPYSFSQVADLKTHQSYDVLYCFNATMQPREFFRTSATEFEFGLFETQNGPFESRNKDESIAVATSAISGDVTLSASSGIFVATDVGSLFKMEVKDFGDTPAWEPGISVVVGDYRTSLERVYRAVSGSKTGSWQPSHTEGVEWDGMGAGTDVNDKDAGGVQWEFVHDAFGVAWITAYTSDTQVSATVLRNFPFSTIDDTIGGAPGDTRYLYNDGYLAPEIGYFIAPAGSVTYGYGTWRWSFGAFSDTRGWPQAGAIWNERLCLVKDSTVYGSVTGDFTDFSTFNEFGEISNDQAFTATINDPNPIVELAADDKLLLFTAAGCFALGPSSAAQGVGPKNLRIDRQHHSGSSAADAVPLNGRTLTVSRCRTRIYETDFDAQRNIESALDLTRYCRHIGRSGFIALAQQQHPHNHVWAVRGDGHLACSSYLPEEDVLGMSPRNLADGLEARDMVSITDPQGRFEQVWIAAEFNGAWHVLRMAPWREDGESDDTGVMLDMAHVHDGVAQQSFNSPLLAGMTVQAVYDGKFAEVEVDEAGDLSLPEPALRAFWGLPYEAAMEQLIGEGGGDNGPSRGKIARISRAWLEVIDARGLWFGEPGKLQPLSQLLSGIVPNQGQAGATGFQLIERAGDNTRSPRLRVERRAPFQSTIAAIGRIIDVGQK